MNQSEYNYLSKIIKQQNKLYDSKLKILNPSEYKYLGKTNKSKPIKVLRSKYFLVQIFYDKGVTRLSINRTTINRQGGWQDKITWDELQNIKSECGFKEHAAIEIYPPDEHIVCDFNMRHLWILDKYPTFMWTKKNRIK